jgi:hypothetical protein
MSIDTETRNIRAEADKLLILYGFLRNLVAERLRLRYRAKTCCRCQLLACCFSHEFWHGLGGAHAPVSSRTGTGALTRPPPIGTAYMPQLALVQ